MLLSNNRQYLENIHVTVINNQFYKSYSENYNAARKVAFTTVIDDCVKIKKDADKDKLPCLQTQASGIRFVKDDQDYFKYWDGLIFIDIDDVSKHYSNVDELERKVAEQYSKSKIYIGSQRSISGNLHLFFYIPAKLHTKYEYYVYAGICYDSLKRWGEIPEECIDYHNFRHDQLFKICHYPFILNEAFNSDIEVDDVDKLYKSISDRDIVKCIDNALMVHEIKPITMYEAGKWPVPEIKTPSKPEILWEHQARLELITTLAKFYDMPVAIELATRVACMNKKDDTNVEKIRKQFEDWAKTSNNDKYNASGRVIEELTKYGFDLYNTTDESALRKPDNIFNLTKEQYLSDIRNELTDIVNAHSITLCEAPAGSGKTQFVLGMNDGVIMTEPYTSVIKNKVEPTGKFNCLYADFHLADWETANQVVCTPDKLVQMDDKYLEGIKYLFVDESHLIFSNSEFRFKVMDGFVKKIKHIAELGIHVILLTGTISLETQLFEDVYYVKVVRDDKYTKDIEFVYAESSKAVHQKVYDIMTHCFADGTKVMIYANDGDLKVDKFMNSYTKITGNTPRWTYFKTSRIDEDNNNSILMNGDIENVDVVFGTSFLGEGLDIMYEGKVKVIFWHLQSLQTIEQYCARLRKTNKDAVVMLNRDIVNGVAKNKYNYSHEYKYLSVNRDDIKSGIHAAELYRINKDNKKVDDIISKLIGKYPYIDIETCNVDEESLALYEMYKSAKVYYSQFGVIYQHLKDDYGFNVKFHGTVISSAVMNEVDKINKAFNKYKQKAKADKWIEAIDEATEANITSLQITYKTKNKALELIKSLYDNGITFENCKELARQCVVNNKIDVKEAESLVSIAHFMWKTMAEKKELTDVYSKLVNDINKLGERKTINHKTYYNFIDDKTECLLNELKLKEGKETKKNVKDIVKKILKMHLKTRKNKNNIALEVRNLGQMFDTQYVI